MTETEEILKVFSDLELSENLWYKWDTDHIKFYVSCNDVFWWATADGEEITAADLPDLIKAYKDLEDDKCTEVYAPELWVARKRGMRPQTPWWNREKIPQLARGLFLLAGPERDRKDEG